jgi:hypothetical protein
MSSIHCLTGSMIVNPATVILQTPELFEAFGMQSRKSIKGGLNLMTTSLLDRGLTTNNPFGGCLLSPAFHVGSPLALQSNTGSSFALSPQGSIL